MIPKVRLCTAFDFVGAGALVGATAALIGVSSFSTLAETIMFSTFFTCFTVAVSAFLMARIVQIAGVVIRNPNPRARRVYQAPATNLATVAAPPVAVTQSPDLQRAA